MGSEWKQVRLGELISVKHGYAFKGDDFSDTNLEGPIVVAIGNFDYAGGFRFESTRIKRSVSEYPEEYEMQPGEVLLAMTCQTSGGEILGIPGVIPDDGETYLHNQRLGKVVLESDKVDLKYLYWLFLSHGFNHHLFTTATGTKILHTAPKRIESYEFPLPPFTEQKSIAHILGTLDDKIELNRRMNATLEEMAQALFKSWFVDFDPVIDNALAAGNPIPDELAARAEVRRQALANGTTQQGSLDHPTLSDPKSLFPDTLQFTEELGWIPEGWEVKHLDDLINLIGGGTPKTSVEEYWNGDIPWFSVVDAPLDSDVFVINTEKKITEEGLNNSSTKLLRPGTTIISARGTVGRCALVGVNMTMNQSCYGIQGADGASDSYTYYSIRHYVADLQQRGHGSVFNTITRDTFRSIKVPFGNAELTEAFEDQVTDRLSRVKGNLQEQTTLTKLRDTLLPKLISGELKASDANESVEEVAR